MERKVKFLPGECYHLYTRGVEKRKIFFYEKDRERFLALLYVMNQVGEFHFTNFLKNKKLKEVFNESKKEELVSIIEYVLMPNHIHLLLYENQEGGISKFMARLLTAYSMYFNKKYDRSGPLFTRPFRSQHISNESQYMWIFSYIHLNPLGIVKKDFKTSGVGDLSIAEKFLKSFKYSSYIDYLGINRPESKIINFLLVPKHIKELALDISILDKNIKGSP